MRSDYQIWRPRKPAYESNLPLFLKSVGPFEGTLLALDLIKGLGSAQGRKHGHKHAHFGVYLTLFPLQRERERSCVYWKPKGAAAKEPAHANQPRPSPLMFWGRCVLVDFEGIWGRC